MQVHSASLPKQHWQVVCTLPYPRMPTPLRAVLSARLGTGKGGVRLAPDELVGSVLQVPLGSVTPLAVCQPSAEGVVLLLDSKLRSVERLFVHPLENTTTTVMSPSGLETFLRCVPPPLPLTATEALLWPAVAQPAPLLGAVSGAHQHCACAGPLLGCRRSVGREPMYVDLECEPRIDKDNPPDLKEIADAAPALAASPAAEDEAGAAAAAASPKAGSAKAAPGAALGSSGGKKGGKKGGEAKAAGQQQPRGDDVLRVTDSVVSKVGGLRAPDCPQGR